MILGAGCAVLPDHGASIEESHAPSIQVLNNPGVVEPDGSQSPDLHQSLSESQNAPPDLSHKMIETISGPTSIDRRESVLNIITQGSPALLDENRGDVIFSERLDLNTPTLALQGPADQIKVGDEFTLSIQADQTRDLYSAPFYLQYDPQVIELISLTEGKFLNQDGKPTAFIYSVDPDTGRVIVGLSRLGEVGGVSGSGALASATFRAKKPGTALLTFQNVDFRNTRFEPVPVNFRTDEIQIR